MEYGAIDLHLRRSQIRILDEHEQVVLDRRIDTTRADFDRVFGGRARMRILLESIWRVSGWPSTSKDSGTR